MSTFYLGKPAFTPKLFTRLDPVAVQEGGRWKTHKEWDAVFPSEGKVFAPRLDNFETGDIVCFGVEPNRLTSDRPDKFIVTAGSPQSVTEVIDLREFGEEQARERIVERGVRDLLRGSDRIIVALSDHTCVVPKMVRMSDRAGYIADQVGLEELAIHSFDHSLFDGDKVENRWVAVPRVTVGREIRTVNWNRDVDFLETVLKRIKKVVTPGEAVLTRGQISQVVSLLSRAELLGHGGDDVKPILRRLENFKPAFIERTDAVARIVEILRSFDGVEEAFHKDVDAKRSALEAALRGEIEAKIRSQLASLSNQVEAKHAEVAHLTEHVTRLRQEAGSEQVRSAAARAAILSDLSAFIEEVSGLPPEMDGKIAPLVKKLSIAAAVDANSLGLLSKPTPPWCTPGLSSAKEHEWKDLLDVLKATALRSGFPLAEYILADIAARAGQIVLIPEGREDFVHSYAASVGGQNAVRHALDPTTLGLDDLWSKPGSNSATGFAKAWTAAQLQPDKFHVVLLDGLHHTPFDLWLPSLVSVLAEPRRPINLLVFCSTGGDFIDRARMWAGLSNTVLPLAPEPSKDDTARALSNIMDQPFAKTSFSCASIPRITQSGFLELFDDARSASSEINRLQILKYHSAAHVYSGTANPQGYVAALARSDVKGDPEGRAAIARGADWLSQTLDNNK